MHKWYTAIIMKTSTIVWVGAAIIIVLGGWYFFSSNAAQAPTNQQPAVTDTPVSNTPVSAAPMAVTITYGPNGFSPANVTIAKGGTVTWVAQAGADEMWVASNPHPTHEGYDGTTKNQHCATGYTGAKPFDQCAAGTNYSFTFNTSGTWGYHNHGNRSDTGVVSVQ